MGDASKSSNDEQPRDPRVEGLATLGWITLAALGICIPLAGVAGAFAGASTVVIPLAILVGSGVLAIRIWSSGEKKVYTKEHEALQERLRDLEERLANLEMVDSLEAHFAAKHGERPSAPAATGDQTTMGAARSESPH